MKVTTLGTGSPLPDPLRAGPASLVQTNGQNLLFDCGRGVLMRLAAVGIPTPAFLHHTFLTHLHSDHVTDFNDLVTSSWALSIGPNPLRVTGPVGTQRLADTTLTMLRDDIGYRLDHHEDLTWQPAVEVTEVTPSEPTAAEPTAAEPTAAESTASAPIADATVEPAGSSSDDGAQDAVVVQELGEPVDEG